MHSICQTFFFIPKVVRFFYKKTLLFCFNRVSSFWFYIFLYKTISLSWIQCPTYKQTWFYKDFILLSLNTSLFIHTFCPYKYVDWEEEREIRKMFHFYFLRLDLWKTWFFDILVNRSYFRILKVAHTINRTVVLMLNVTFDRNEI
jgi:hypothetical protein